jgi:Heterokaryon incompatibility protein (HET)
LISSVSESMAKRSDPSSSSTLFSFPAFDLGFSPSGKQRHSVDWPYASKYPEYTHRSLLADGSFRLLKILQRDVASSTIYARLEEFALHECPSYYALSYTWGKPTESDDEDRAPSSYRNPWQLLILDEQDLCKALSAVERPIAITEDTEPSILSLEPHLRSVKVGQNLRDCLGRISNFNDWMPAARKPDNEVEFPVCNTDYLWIDAICIDQTNEIEKASQIPLMGNIYSNAELVIVWLGENSGEKMFNTFLWMHSVFENAIYKYHERFLNPSQPEWGRAIPEWRHVDPVDEEFWKEELDLEPLNDSWRLTWWYYLEFFERNSWFARSWTMQEIRLARDSVFMCGKSFMHGSNIFGLFGMIPPQWLGLLNSRGFPCYRLVHFKLLTARGEKEAAVRDPSSTILFQTFWDDLAGYLWQAKSRECRFAQDKVLSVLGIASKSLPPGTENPFKVKPGFTPEETYIWVTKMQLRSSANLYVLSLVEDKSERIFNSMPSWVPDFSVRSVTPLCHQDAFNATLVEPTDSPRSVVGESTLSVRGRCFGTVSTVYPHLELYDLLKAVIDILPKMEPVYSPTGENRTQAFWRTLIRDHDNDEFHPHDDLYYGFTAILAAIAARSKQPDLKHPSTGIEKKRLVAVLNKRANSMTQGVRFQLRSVDIGFVLVPELFEGVSRDHERRFSQAFQVVQRGIHFFQTSNEYIGMCRPSAKPCDLVFLLEGGKVPYILRKNDDETYTFVGECYVHGVMQGQLMIPEFKDGFEIITIV